MGGRRHWQMVVVGRIWSCSSSGSKDHRPVVDVIDVGAFGVDIDIAINTAIWSSKARGASFLPSGSIRMPAPIF